MSAFLLDTNCISKPRVVGWMEAPDESM